jgi:excisionase family DNA binding protein
MTPRLAYPITEAAQLLGISARSVRYLMKTGRLGFARIGRRVLIPGSELDRLLKRASVRASEPLDADTPIRPTAQNGNAPSGKLEASGPDGVRHHAEFDGDSFHDTPPAA